MRHVEARKFIIEKLKNNSKADNYYHNISHALEVESAVKLIAKQFPELRELEIELLSISALCHDIGYSENCEDHERISADFAKNNLGQFGYSQDELNTISKLILSTKFPHSPSNLKERIICDADLSYLGGENYFKQVSRLKTEYKECNIKEFSSENEWIEYQLKFLRRHRFFTDFAVENFEKNKREIIVKLEKMIK
jgi:predicted metal-dependent HD superfamily phosphohydrolase